MANGEPVSSFCFGYKTPFNDLHLFKNKIGENLESRHLGRTTWNILGKTNAELDFQLLK